MSDRRIIPPSIKNVNLEKSIEVKLNSMVVDEIGLFRPVLISVVIPTKIDAGKKTRRKELKTLSKILEECSKLADLGYIDEIIVIDASVYGGGKPDYSVLTKVIKTAYLHLRLFRREVDLIASSKAESLHASKGFFNFFVKVVHQFDPIITKLLENKNVFKKLDVERVPSGKGAALWLSVPMCNGDIVCFIDSDIMNFKKEIVISLCNPLIKSINNKASPKTIFSKAYYKRLTLRYESEAREFVFGGRVTRLFIKPMLRILSNRYPDIFKGFDKINYPLSGENAIFKNILESLYFPCDYNIELSTLYQIIKKYSVESIAQVDLDLFYHIGQSVKGLHNMVSQLSIYLVKLLEENGITLSEDTINKLVNEYLNESKRWIEKYKLIYYKDIQPLSKGIKAPIHYSESTERERVELFSSIFLESVKNRGYESKILPAWKEFMSQNDYILLSSLLKYRVNQFTYDRLIKADLVRKF
ncbi:MAG: hypothetical protein H5T50_07460 [Nitrososphaeria archaeon]|nr:hypothetical protein [Nitrososphaeria archaeon]